MSALVNVPLRLNVSVRLLQSSHAGAIRCPVTPEFFACAPRTGALEQPTTEQTEGQDLLECFNQWSLHDPHGQFLLLVPAALDQPELGNVAISVFSKCE